MTNENLKILIKEELSSVLAESGLNRIFQYVTEHQCGILSAWRSDVFNRSLCVGKNFTDEELESFNGSTSVANKINNRNLKAFLLKKGYGVTKVGGNYIENFTTPSAREVSEDSFFVVNFNDDLDFFDTIKMLGKKYCQDSVLLIELGGEDGYLFGTNKGDFPGLGLKVSQGGIKLGEPGQFMSRIGGRPFKFSNQRKLTPEEEKFFSNASSEKTRNKSNQEKGQINERLNLIHARLTEGLETYKKLPWKQQQVVDIIASRYF